METPSLYDDVTAPNFAPAATRCLQRCPRPHYMPTRDGGMRDVEGIADNDLCGYCVCNPELDVFSVPHVIIFDHKLGKMFKLEVEKYMAVCLYFKYFVR